VLAVDWRFKIKVHGSADVCKKVEILLTKERAKSFALFSLRLLYYLCNVILRNCLPSIVITASRRMTIPEEGIAQKSSFLETYNDYPTTLANKVRNATSYTERRKSKRAERRVLLFVFDERGGGGGFF